MHVLLDCECGRQLTVADGAAGSDLLCACGRTLRVPSLGQLRSPFADQAEIEAPAEGRFSTAKIVLLLIAAMWFGMLWLGGSLLSLAAGGTAGTGYLVALVGQVWLLVLIVRECRPEAILYALLIPFFTWYFAYQRWDIARWGLVCNVGGILLWLFAVVSSS